jgi:hypothetical protein
LWRRYGTENAVPLTRYFLIVGSVLIALLFGANWIWPSAQPAQSQNVTAQAALDAPVARIHSTQKWPDKIEFDTSKPTIVPPTPVIASMTQPAPVVAENARAASPLDARAEAKPDVQPAPPRKRVARAHHRSPRQTRWATAYPMAPSWGGWNW